MPMEYQRATDHFRNYLSDAKAAANLSSSHQTYTMTQAVFQTFRRRLDIKDAIRFSNILPACLRALFVAEWDVDEPKRPFDDLERMTKEVQSLRANHNFSPENAISAVSHALKKYIDPLKFRQVLNDLPVGAKEFWNISEDL